ncbi:Nucleolar protein 9, variant 2 [Orbilia ellipsospora]|uniref:Nucleolar protein 9 n=1 Tax=Orbilia ellipsospora TaxID=2528407 RepID=A0AAV9XM72_9PEZI
MPKELKKRGRREAKRQKLSHNDDGYIEPPKESPQGLVISTQAFVAGEDSANNGQLPFESSIPPGTTFYGLLDDQEQEYFRKADDMLEANQFNSDEEREMFTRNVLKETENKELKMACSQGCSRLLEKLLFLADSARVKLVFQRFHGNFSHLMSHRFASHCCEALFTAAASIASTEYLGPTQEHEMKKNQAIHIPAETLFLQTVTELETSIDNLLMNPFGAHPLRTLFLVLSGAPLQSQSNKSLLHSKKKENISFAKETSEDGRKQARLVPEAFREALSKIINTITSDISRESIRNLATDPLGSPTLQLLIELDLGRSRKYKTKIEESLVGKLMLDLPGEEERETDATRSFVKMLLHDTVGSHLLERVMMCVPKKVFNQLYGVYFRGNMGKLASNDTACFVVTKVLDKLEIQEFKGASTELQLELPSLLEHHRIAVIRSVIETYNKHGISADEFCNSLFQTLGSGMDEEFDLLLKMLDINTEELAGLDLVESKEREKRRPGQLHASLLVQALLTVPGQCSNAVKDRITSCSSENLRRLCKHPTASHAIQKSLVVGPLDMTFKRKFASLLSGSIADLALHPVGSHVVDTLWEATLQGPKLQRQRIADELLCSERMLRDSFHGRAVWRNWKMDLYKTRRYDWSNNVFGATADASRGTEVKKSALQVREKDSFL